MSSRQEEKERRRKERLAAEQAATEAAARKRRIGYLVGTSVAVIGLFLAMIDLPDFSTPLRRIAGSVEKLAGVPPEEDPTEPPKGAAAHGAVVADDAKASAAKNEVKNDVKNDVKSEVKNHA